MLFSVLRAHMVTADQHNRQRWQCLIQVLMGKILLLTSSAKKKVPNNPVQGAWLPCNAMLGRRIL